MFKWFAYSTRFGRDWVLAEDEHSSWDADRKRGMPALLTLCALRQASATGAKDR